MDKIPARQLIVEAVVTCIEKYGIDKLTTRKIAEEAGTNVASINYYFRSKEQLISEALTTTIQHMMQDVIATIEAPDLPFDERLTSVFFYLIDGAIRFPGITTAHLYDAVIDKHYDSPGAQGIRKVFQRLVERTVEEYPHKDRADLQLTLAQITTSIMFTTLAPDFFPVAAKYRPTSSKNCRVLAERYVRLFFKSI